MVQDSGGRKVVTFRVDENASVGHVRRSSVFAGWLTRGAEDAIDSASFVKDAMTFQPSGSPRRLIRQIEDVFGQQERLS